MSDKNNDISMLGANQIRRIWHNDEWYYSIIDVIAFLTDSAHSRTYWAKLKARLKNEGFNENLEQLEPLKLKSPDGKWRQTDTANRQTLLRLIQSIPSPNAEPFRVWLAQVGEERLEEIEHPEIALQRMREAYRAKGYDDNWIEQRIKTDLIRNELTDEWKERGAREGVEYAILTNEIHTGTFELNIEAHKNYKLLPAKTNLRDHMTNVELALISLGEATTTMFHQDRDSKGFEALRKDAKNAGSLTGETRRRIEESRGGKSVVSPTNYLEQQNQAKKQLKQGPQLEMFPDGTESDE
jgi:DNA-damage-inducible protein D